MIFQRIFLSMALLTSLATAAQTPLAIPSAVQFAWQERERIMFVHFGIATFLGKEYDDNGNYDISKINPTKLNTDEWCRVALSWGAKQIIFVAKHAGSFCWWQTPTSEYSVKNIAWRNGKGDLLDDISRSCKKFGLKLGVYIFPGDVHYGAGMGSGGITTDPAMQETYNKVFRQQLTEVLTKYGEISEVWFDGNCKIYVSDILKKHASKAVIFQGSDATLRWPGTESGMLAYPSWNTVSMKKLRTGTATQFDDDPNGDAWAPSESDLPLYSHYWFWNAHNETKRKSVAELMEVYYKSVGYGGVMLLNCSPDTSGAVAAGDKAVYKALGDEISRRFAQPVASIANRRSKKIALTFQQPADINHVVFGEDYREGHRIHGYRLYLLTAKGKQLITSGSSVGRKKIDAFATTRATGIELVITESIGTPMIRSLQVFAVKAFNYQPAITEERDWQTCGEWNTSQFTNGRDTLVLELNKFISKPGQYECRMVADVAVTGTSIDTVFIEVDGSRAMQDYLQKNADGSFYINRTGQVTSTTSTKLTLYMHSDNAVFQNRGRFIIRERK